LPPIRESAILHNEYLKDCLAINIFCQTRQLSPKEIEEKKKSLEVLKQYLFFY
jgi:hypothetical protein